jgi:hypothetical protein|tara:strand:- start:1090 stop:1329 length:240 start_codon:yes stop_codon:yes gene_type:complete
MMPLYTIKNTTTDESWEVQCTWSKLQEMLSEDKNLTQGLSTAGFIGSRRDMLGQTPQGFKDLMNRTKEGSGRNNTIRTV